MKKILYSLFVISVCAIPVFAQPSSVSREERIDREMNCINDRVSNKKELNWQDVCYSNRDEDVSKSLDDVAKEQDDLFPEQHSDAMYQKSQDQFYNDWGSGDSSIGKAAANEAADPVAVEAATKAVEKREAVKEVQQDKEDWDEVLDKPDQEPKPYSEGLKSPKQSVEIGTETYSYDYEEPLVGDDGPNFARIRGQFWGVYLNYTARPQEDDPLYMDVVNYYRIETRFARASGLDYDSYGTGSAENNDDYIFEITGTLGKDLSFSPSFRATPYLGLGFRYLNDDSAGQRTSTGALGYERESRYFYIPMGVVLDKQLNSNWKLGWTGEYDWFASGTQKSHLTDVNPILGDVDNDQKKGFGLKTSVKLTREGRRFNVSAEPFIRYWHIEDSEFAVSSTGIIGGTEPENLTHEFGIKFGAEF